MLSNEKIFESEITITSKINAFQELEKMLVPISQELDYDKELSEARDKKYIRISL